MQADRELLELAAKAARIVVLYNVVTATGLDVKIGPYSNAHWNPLTNDGDALRLAVKLGIDLLFTAEDIEAVATQYAREEDQEMISPWACESWTLKPQDPFAATRRAIVRAAAEIGRAMG